MGELEHLIDRLGLYRVTELIGEICGEKAEHLRSNWQDEEAAKHWDKAAKQFEKTESALRKIQGNTF